MIQTVEKTITQYSMFEKGEKIIIGISGGPDSVALTHILSSIQQKYKLTLHLAHLNHLLREEAKQEAIFVQELAESLNLPVTIEEIDVAQEKSRNFSLEQKARKVRYEFLIRVAKDLGATKIALAHHLDDNLETIMMWLIRGCGAEGFEGIPPVREIVTIHSNEVQGNYSNQVIGNQSSGNLDTDYQLRVTDNRQPIVRPLQMAKVLREIAPQLPGKPLSIIRPLINITKQEIEHYLKEHKLSFKIDSSNLEKDYLRNKIRLELLPRLEEYNPKIKEALIKFSLLWKVDNEYLNFLSSQARDKVILENGSLELKGFSELHQAIQTRILRQIIAEVKEDLEGITFKHIEAILNLIKDGPAQGSLDLPSNIKVKREYGQLWICQGNGSPNLFGGKQGKSAEREKGEKRYLIVPGVTEIERGQIETRLLSKEAFPSFFSSPTKAYLDYDKLKLPIVIRHRKCGDKFHPYGLAGTKKIKDFLMDLKVAKKVRDTVYLLEDGQGIIWIMGFDRIDERVKITEATKNVLLIEERKVNL